MAASVDPSIQVAEYLLLKARQWHSSLAEITSRTEQRKGDVSDLANPGLSTHNDTTLGYSSFSSDAYPLPLAVQAATRPIHTATNTTQLGIPPPSPLPRSPSPAASSLEQGFSQESDYRRRNAVVVYYDGSAQKSLEHMVNDVSTAQSSLRRRRDQDLNPVADELAEAKSLLDYLAAISDLCHSAAFKLLQDGGAATETAKIESLVHDMCLLLQSSTMRQEEARRAHEAELARLQESLGSVAPLGTVNSLSKPHSEPLEVDDAMDVDDDDDDEELILPTLRLTSRFNAR